MLRHAYIYLVKRIKIRIENISHFKVLYLFKIKLYCILIFTIKKIIKSLSYLVYFVSDYPVINNVITITFNIISYSIFYFIQLNKHVECNCNYIFFLKKLKLQK